MATTITQIKEQDRRPGGQKKDKGEQYAVMCRKMDGSEIVYGYAKTLEKAALMEISAVSSPDYRSPRTVDRHDEKLCEYRDSTYPCPYGATKKYDPDEEEQIDVACTHCGATKQFKPQQKLDTTGRIVRVD